MITLRRAGERRYRSHHGQKLWHTFRASRSPPPDGFGALLQLDEEWRPPDVESAQRRCRDTEILTYVREGSLAYRDSAGRASVIRAGELHHMNAGGDLRRDESNASATEPVHLFQISLLAGSPGLASSCAQKRFNLTERRGKLCVIASPDARFGSLPIHGSAVMCSAMLSRGQHVVHELASGRGAWLHVVQGEVTLGDAVLTTGDGAAITAARAVSLTARADSEILLIELEAPPLPS